MSGNLGFGSGLVLIYTFDLGQPSGLHCPIEWMIPVWCFFICTVGVAMVALSSFLVCYKDKEESIVLSFIFN